MRIKKYKRIVILGSGGSGKTTLANYITKKTNLPIVYLDKEYWLPNWERPDNDVWNQKLTTLVQNDQWVMDGNYIDSLDIRLNKADLVIMLDIKPSICVSSVFFRTLLGHFIRRNDLSEGCKDKFDDKYVDLIKWVKEFKNIYFTQLIDLCLKYPNIDLKLFTKRKNARKFVKRMARQYQNEEN